MNYWIFKCNPELYRIANRLNDPNPVITWKVSRYRDEIKAGDVAFIWRTGGERGVVGAILLRSDPHLMKEIPSELPFGIGEPENGKQVMVIGELVARKTLPAGELRKIPGLKNLSAFRRPYQGTNFPVTCEEGQLLCGLLQLD